MRTQAIEDGMLSEELTTADANRRFYAAAAEEYDLTEDCVIDPVERERLRRALSMAIAAASERRHVLDACGGSGNASLVLHELV